MTNGTSPLNIIKMLKFLVSKLFSSNFTMEMFSLPILSTKTLPSQEKKQFKHILMHPKKIFTNFFLC